MSATAVVLLALLAIPAGVVPLIRQWTSLRRNTLASRRVRLAGEYFSGNQHVVAAPGQWRLSVSDVQQTAAQSGYEETAPPAQGFVTFNHAPAAVARHAVNPGAVSAGQWCGRESIAPELTEGDFLWRSAMALTLSPAL